MSMYLSNLLLSLFSLPRLVSLWFKFAPRAFVCPPRSVVMDGLWHMNQRQIHHHVARAIMHLNYIAGTLPFFELAIEWEDSAPPPHHPNYATTKAPSHPQLSSPYFCTHAQPAILIVCLDDFSWWLTHPHGSES